MFAMPNPKIKNSALEKYQNAKIRNATKELLMRPVMLLKLHLSLKRCLCRRRRIIHHSLVRVQPLLLPESCVMHRRWHNERELNGQKNHRN